MCEWMGRSARGGEEKLAEPSFIGDFPTFGSRSDFTTSLHSVNASRGETKSQHKACEAIPAAVKYIELHWSVK